MRTIEVSTSVYALIWSRRLDGEENESEILERILLAPLALAQVPDASTNINELSGVRDARSSVHFPEGFKIFRTYRGQHFEGRATGGKWHLIGTDVTCGTLNELNKAIGTGPENAWARWQFQDADGNMKPVSELRSPSKISRRKKQSKPGNNLSALKRIDTKLPEPLKSWKPNLWRKDVFRALLLLGGRATLTDLYPVVSDLRAHEGASLPANSDAIIRRCLEESSSDSEAFNPDYLDLFTMTHGKGEGVWAIRRKWMRG